ncbi:response regulator [Sphingomonas lutea]|uniref:histidine kinase n=2 Tax=Sphingomonas lutea TaxID=1045317 RepID=A0A7G9SJJ5_9SPHN|nr:ATP-binding protein [Sphingomonas lutea]QNN68020.1 response regulator [Sphingomonas lutea]
MNLIINARDAMPEGGTIVVSAENRTASDDDPLPLHEGDYVVISVIDRGCGISPELLDKVLEPFFTTKEVGKGTGLGLSMVYGFAKQTGGTLNIESKVGVGTCTELWLPRATGNAARKGPRSNVSQDPVAQRSLRILLIDDHAEVRGTTAAMLRDLGHSTVDVGTGAEGVEILSADERKFDLLVTDYAMPRLSGTEVIKLARQHVTDLPALIVTGYADMDEVSERPSDVGLLLKPFTVHDLSRAVQGAVESR